MPTLAQRIIFDVPLWSKTRTQVEDQQLNYVSEPEFIMEGVAGENLSALKAVTKREDDLIWLCDVERSEPCVGITVQSSNAGSTITYISLGEITDSSIETFNWDRGTILRVQGKGNIVSTWASNLLIIIGQVIDRDTILVRIENPFIVG